MAWRFAPPLQPSLLTIKNAHFNSPNSLSIFGKSLKSSMLKSLLISSSSRYYISKKPIKFHLHNNTTAPFAKSTGPCSSFLRRPIHSLSVLAMAEQSSSSSSSQAAHKHTNRLASEHSPYLLQHAHNPVDWYPWGEEAFAEARKRDVPIFLSIGYSTCHWCHVMEVESFEDEEVAKLLNDWFISIKVDREERPDVDKVYMTYVQALYGGGGWPLSVFLSPDLKPLMGGTYFPPEDSYGRPGFKTILRKVKEAWNSKRDMLVQSGSFAIEQLSEAMAAVATSNKLSDEVPETALRKCADHLGESYDSKYGGFGSAPKFPRPVEMQLMLYSSKRSGETGKSGEAKNALNMVLFTLECMARGGIHDHVGGGFHRYSVDECWHVPHFDLVAIGRKKITNLSILMPKSNDIYLQGIDYFSYEKKFSVLTRRKLVLHIPLSLRNLMIQHIYRTFNHIFQSEL